MSQVFLLPSHPSDSEADFGARIASLWDRAGLGRVFRPKDLAALKLHVGEPGTTTFVSPTLVRELVGLMAATGARPFLTDSSVLYRSPRDSGVGHARVAEEHGFGLAAVGAPFIPADGLDGSDEVTVRVEGKHFEEVAVAASIMHARSLLVLSHATGHLGTGLGAALKNLGMGCCSKKAKLRQHHGQQPRINPDSCTACGVCAEWCPTGALQVGEAHADIDAEECIGCGECVAVCREGAVEFDWGVRGRELQERVVEHAAAVVRKKSGRIGYVTVAEKITKNCDCLGVSEPALVADIGILASHDPVAIDQAVLQLVRERAGCSLESLSYPQHDASIQVRHAEALGLGESRVDLVTLDA